MKYFMLAAFLIACGDEEKDSAETEETEEAGETEETEESE